MWRVQEDISICKYKCKCKYRGLEGLEKNKKAMERRWRWLKDIITLQGPRCREVETKDACGKRGGCLDCRMRQPALIHQRMRSPLSRVVACQSHCWFVCELFLFRFRGSHELLGILDTSTMCTMYYTYAHGDAANSGPTVSAPPPSPVEFQWKRFLSMIVDVHATFY